MPWDCGELILKSARTLVISNEKRFQRMLPRVAANLSAEASEKRKCLPDQKAISFRRVSSVHGAAIDFLICKVGDFTGHSNG
jgi:hypothetical protein